MFIKVAGEKKEYPEGLTVESGAFESTEVKDGDEIEFLYFMGGGAR